MQVSLWTNFLKKPNRIGLAGGAWGDQIIVTIGCGIHVSPGLTGVCTTRLIFIKKIRVILPNGVVKVGFGYDKHKLGELNYSEDDYPILENMIQGLGTHTSLGDFSGERRRKTIVAFDNSSPLDDSFAKTLSDNLRPIIESVTPAIDDLEEERISQHYAP